MGRFGRRDPDGRRHARRDGTPCAVRTYSLVMPFPSIRAGLDTLLANPLRTLLSTLGVIMGAASLVAVLSLGDGAEAFARQRIVQEGYNHVIVEPITSDLVDGQRIARASYPIFDPADARTLAPEIHGRAVGVLAVQDALLWEGDGTERRGLGVTGLTPIGTTLPVILPIVAGRGLTPDEARDEVPAAVVSRRLAKLLAGAAGEATIVGRAWTLSGAAIKIIGVQEDRVGDRGLAVVLPLALAERVLGPSARPRPRRIVLEATRFEHVRNVHERAKAWVGRHGDWSTRVRVAAVGQQRMQEVERGILVFKMLMGAFTAIALIVGGIGIMNVLLASVVERTREIGIRKAIGARRRDILTQFLTESVAIAGAGCVLGLVIGLVGAFGVTALIRARTEMQVFAGVSGSTLAASAFAALLVGLVFGTYPALRAARLSPIDAIQRE